MGDPAFYREMATKRFDEAAKQMAVELESLGLQAEVLAKVLAQWRESADAILKECFETGAWSKIERANLVDFVDRLLNRQAAIPPDFDELYKRKAELDGNFDDPRR